MWDVMRGLSRGGEDEGGGGSVCGGAGVRDYIVRQSLGREPERGEGDRESDQSGFVG